MTFRLAHISDSHLSRDKPFFVENFTLVAAALAASRPDLVVNTGDMSLDGVAEEGDLAEARSLHDVIGLPTRFIPGNHDIGETHDVPGTREVLICEATRDRYRRHFGDDFWQLDVPGWRLVAINSQLLACDLEAARTQLDFVAQAAASAEGRRLALLVHKPLFDATPEESDVGGRFVNPEPRRRLLAALGGRPPAVIASGHVHQHRDTLVAASRHVWAPSTGFIIPDTHQPHYGAKQVGYVEHRLEPDGAHASTFIQPPGVQRLDMADFVAAAYGRYAGPA